LGRCQMVSTLMNDCLWRGKPYPYAIYKQHQRQLSFSSLHGR